MSPPNCTKLLFVSATPPDRTRLEVDRELRAVGHRIRSGPHRERFALVACVAACIDDLRAALFEHRPHIVHFSGHADHAGRIVLCSEAGTSMPVPQAALATMLAQFHDTLRLVVFNACHSSALAERVTEHIDFGIGMDRGIGDAAGCAFAAVFYESIAAGETISRAFSLAENAIRLRDLPAPGARLFQKPGARDSLLTRSHAPAWPWRVDAAVLGVLALFACIAASERPVPVSAAAVVPTVTHVALPDTAPMPFVRLPSGEFRMGSDDAGSERDERPVHLVTVSPFWIAATEVTRAQWREVMLDESAVLRRGRDTGAHPVRGVAWYQALRYANALSEREGRTACYVLRGADERPDVRPNCDGYRLPTEAEWEYACRAGTRTAYSFGEDDEQLARYGRGESKTGVLPAGSLEPSPWGLYDMHGNIWEWVWDGYAAYTGESQRDPVGSGDSVERVIRGGAYKSGSDHLRCANRQPTGRASRDESYGFRLVRSAP